MRKKFVKSLCSCYFQGHAKFLLPLFIATAMSFPIRNSYDRRIYKYDHFPATRYVRQIIPFYVRQNRTNYIPEESIYNRDVFKIKQEEPKDSQCKYFYIFNKVSNVKVTYSFINIAKSLEKI